MRAVSLAVHRNTRDRRRRHEIADHLKRNASDMIRAKTVDAYIIITLDANDGYKTAYVSGNRHRGQFRDVLSQIISTELGPEET